MSDLKLKPCPFCGGEASAIHTNDTVYIECDLCLAYMGDNLKSLSARKGKLYFNTEKEAVEAWNRRSDNDGY